MTCSSVLNDFYDLIIGGVVTGLIASFLFIPLSRLFSNLNFKWKYTTFQSKEGQFDWIAYSMSPENGRVRDQSPNGSKANIRIKNGKINLTIEQPDRRRWKGQVKMLDFDFGILTLKYENEREYLRRDCVFGFYLENNKRYSYIFIMAPANHKIYYLSKDEKGQLIPHYEYGNEILIREKV